MFLKHAPTSDLVEVLDLDELFDPFAKTIMARTQAGEDTVDIGTFSKRDLAFPSGEPLPLCWLDSHYRNHMQPKSGVAAVQT